MSHFVTEKEETAGTAAKAGLFWALLAAPFLWLGLKRKQRKRKKFFKR